MINNKVLDYETNVITWDGYGYYVYLPALLIYQDASKFSFTHSHFDDYPISSSQYQLRQTENGNRFPIYNIGLALIWLPFFLIAHYIAVLFSPFPADGLSFPYQLSIIISSIVYLTAGLIYLNQFLSNLFSTKTALITLFILLFGTNFFYYFIEGQELTHIYLFCIYCAFLYYYQQYKTLHRRKYLLLCGILAGLLILIRSSEIVVFLLPLFYQSWNTSFKKDLYRGISDTTIIFILAATVFGIQILFYKLYTGYWFLNGYEGHHFDFLDPHFWECFFGYRRGLFVYTPLMFLSITGMFLLFKLKNEWSWSVLLFFIVNSYIIYSWHIWWYGSTFGSRPIVQAYAVLSIPLAATIFKINHQKPLFRTIIFLLISFLIFLNLFQTWQYQKGIIPQDFTTKTYYWHTFLKTTKNNHDFKYLDINEKIPNRNFSFTIHWQLDSSIWVLPGENEYHDLYNKTLHSNSDIKTFSNQWIQNSIRYSYTGDSFDKWTAPRLVTEIRRDGTTIKWTGLNLPKVMNNRQLDSIDYFQKFPILKEGDKIKVYVWNTSQDSIEIFSLKINTVIEP